MKSFLGIFWTFGDFFMVMLLDFHILIIFEDIGTLAGMTLMISAAFNVFVAFGPLLLAAIIL